MATATSRNVEICQKTISIVHSTSYYDVAKGQVHIGCTAIQQWTMLYVKIYNVILTPNMFLKSGSLNLNGILDTWSLLGVVWGFGAGSKAPLLLLRRLQPLPGLPPCCCCWLLTEFVFVSVLFWLLATEAAKLALLSWSTEPLMTSPLLESDVLSIGSWKSKIKGSNECLFGILFFQKNKE